MKMIVGLGNPGKEYENSRHNAGWMAVDELQREVKGEPFKEEKKFKALISDANYMGERLILVKPLTFMNLSGEAVQAVSAFYKVDPGDILCVYDDLDTPFGSIRIRARGGAGTHNGMKSMVQQLGEGFPRLRIGIESRGEKAPIEHETTSFVLGKFNKNERLTLSKMMKKCAEAVKTWISDGIEASMNGFNGKD